LWCLLVGVGLYKVTLQLVEDVGKGVVSTVAVAQVTERERVAYNSLVTIRGLALQCGHVYQWQLQVFDVGSCNNRTVYSRLFTVDSLQVRWGCSNRG
jgi:hypothetical protein